MKLGFVTHSCFLTHSEYLFLPLMPHGLTVTWTGHTAVLGAFTVNSALAWRNHSLASPRGIAHALWACLLPSPAGSLLCSGNLNLVSQPALAGAMLANEMWDEAWKVLVQRRDWPPVCWKPHAALLCAEMWDEWPGGLWWPVTAPTSQWTLPLTDSDWLKVLSQSLLNFALICGLINSSDGLLYSKRGMMWEVK